VVPLLPGYRWHWVARIWRRRGLGEFANATTTKWSSPSSCAKHGPIAARCRRSSSTWSGATGTRGTRDATLALYRHADPDRLAAAGKDLDRLSCPALILWGDGDIYLPTRFAHAYAKALPDAEVEIVPGAGHWPWIDDPAVVNRVLAFLG
jgi:pimeloyl-ACP methyl ester carboxylesterase